MMQEFSDPSVVNLPTVKVSDEAVEPGSCLRLCGLTMGGLFARSSPALRYENNDYDTIGDGLNQQPPPEQPAESGGESTGRSGAYSNLTPINQVPLALPKAHHDSVSCVQSISKGICLSGSNDNTLALYDYQVGKLLSKWTGHTKGVTACCHHDENYFSASRDTSICMWRRDSLDCSKPAHTYSGHGLLVSAVQVNQDGTLLLSGSRDNSLKIWDVETGCVTREQNISRNLVTDLKWFTRDNIILQTSEDKQVRLWDSRTLSVVHSFSGKQYIQTCCDVSEDGHYGLTASNGFMLGQGCEATLWDLRGKRVAHQYVGHEQSVNCCSFLPPSTSPSPLVVTGGNDSTLRVWDRDTAKCLTQMYVVGAGPLNGVACCEDGSMCVATFNLGIHVLYFTPQEGMLLQKAMY